MADSSDDISGVELKSSDDSRASVSSRGPVEVRFHFGSAPTTDSSPRPVNGYSKAVELTTLDLNGSAEKDGKEKEPHTEKRMNANGTLAEKGQSVETGSDGEKKADGSDAKPKVRVIELFRYATKWDWLLIFIGTIGAMANGFALPSFSLIFGGLLNSFNADDIESTVSTYSLYFVYVAIASLVASWLELSFYMIAAENQAKKVREEFLQSILRQEPAYLEAMKAGDFMHRLTEGTKLYQEAVGEKINNLFHHGTTFFGGIIIGLVKGWQLALIVLACTPLLALCGAIMAHMLSGLSSEGAKAYAGAGSVASEVLGQLRTVVAFSGENHEQKRYDEKLAVAEKAGVKKGLVTGGNMGFTMLVVFGTYGLALWYGGKLIADGTNNPTTGNPYNGGDITTVFFAVIMGAFSLGNLAPNIPSIINGQVAAYELYSVIDRRSQIDPLSKDGIKLNKGSDAKVRLEFRNVSFSYASRASVPILRDFNLAIEPGQTVALCGSSGCGKSTIVSLLERFYDPLSGEILVDGNRLTDMNVSHWRSQIGLVRQEPSLFSTTIEENIRYGKPSATFEEVVAAAKAANIHDTIDALPNKYQTNVGEEGRMLSGGQKQRVAIARAIIRDPLLLILDEATSALDSENERIVQAQLDQIMKQRQRTTIIIAHRLSTIRNADVIVCMHQGKIVEMGKHDELMARRGAYFQLVQKQDEILRRNTIGDGEEKEGEPAIQHFKLRPLAADGKVTHSRAPSEVSTPTVEQLNEDDKEEDTLKKENEGEVTTVQTVAPKKPTPRLPPGALKRLFMLTRPDWGWFALGVIGACGHGLVFPGFSQILSNMIGSFYLTDHDEMRREIRKWALVFLSIGVGTMIMAGLQFSCIGITGERLTKRLRSMLFAKFLSLHMGFYDAEENKSGVLVTKLANEAADVQSIITGPAAQLFQVASLTASALIFAFVYGWKLALVVLATAPLMVMAGWLQMKFVGGFSSKAKDAVEKAGQVANESIQNLKTVASFGAEAALLGRFTQILVLNRQAGIRRAHLTGGGFGSSQFILFASYGLAFWYGGRLVQNHEMSFPDVLRVFFAIVMAAMGAGQSAQLAPDYQKANTAVVEIFRLLDTKVELTSVATDGNEPTKEGELEFSNVSFAYPSRPDQLVLERLNLRFPKHTTTAIVGSSGSGKSTIVQLLERFYEPASGTISMDGVDIRSIALQTYRQKLGFVQQEPVLFHGTLKENLRYGAWNASDDQVVKAAQDANIHNFIQTLPDKYETNVGAKGLDLSGGQKQRCAIARAIVRQPKLLLLDEATSALDAESEAQVEAAIREVQQKWRCTTIVIAHRLQTIKHADQIVVLEKGKLVEGPAKHEELLAANGRYAALWHAQQKKGTIAS